MNTNVERFYEELLRTKRENTANSYFADVRKFLEDMEKIKSISVDSDELLKAISNDDVEDWFKDCKNKYTVTTVNRKISALSKFFEYILHNKESKKLIVSNPFENTSYSKVKKKEKVDYIEDTNENVLTLDEVKRLLEISYKKMPTDRCFNFNSARFRFLIALMCSTGLRVSEALTIEFDDIVKIESGDYMINFVGEKVKNNTCKRVPICGLTKKYFFEYLEEREKINVIDESVLFVTSRGKKMYRTDTEREILKYSDRAGLNKTINNHTCRHTFRTILTLNNTNESLICIIGGWSRTNLSMSATYTHDTIALDPKKIAVCNIF